MACTQSNAGEERPLFRDYPLVIFDVVGVCKERIEGQKRQGVEMGKEGEADMQAGPRDLG